MLAGFLLESHLILGSCWEWGLRMQRQQLNFQVYNYGRFSVSGFVPFRWQGFACLAAGCSLRQSMWCDSEPARVGACVCFLRLTSLPTVQFPVSASKWNCCMHCCSCNYMCFKIHQTAHFQACSSLCARHSSTRAGKRIPSATRKMLTGF